MITENQEQGLYYSQGEGVLLFWKEMQVFCQYFAVLQCAKGLRQGVQTMTFSWIFL